MATKESLGLLSLFDENGNRVLLYPVTTADAVDGLEDLLNELEVNVKNHADSKHTNLMVTILAGGWVDNVQTIRVYGVTEDCTVVAGPDISCESEYAACEVWCSSQGTDTLTFSCTFEPNVDLYANIALMM